MVGERFVDPSGLCRNFSIFGSDFIRAKAVMGSNHGSNVSSVTTSHLCSPANPSLVVALSGLAVYSGDFILSTIQRVIGTAFGLCYGMMIWYIGSESIRSC